jgi:peptidyl-prolyl cis-trans isomerase A (cyclophilin A)
MTPALRAIPLLLAATIATGTPPSPARPQGWYAVVETSMGSFTIHLLPEQAPQTVAHFVSFAEGRTEWVDIMTGNKKKAPFYDGLTVHKVTAAQRFEAGDPTGTGHGAPLDYVPKESGPEDFSRPFRVGMTASGMQRISGALFFVSMVAEPYLNPSHNCFGEVVDGRDVVEAICNVKTADNVPVTPVIIKHVTIEKSGAPAPIADPVPYRPKKVVPIPRTDTP